MPDRGRRLYVNRIQGPFRHLRPWRADVRWRPWRRWVWTVRRQGLHELAAGQFIERQGYALTYRAALRQVNRWMDA